jgi:hypothetical protein
MNKEQNPAFDLGNLSIPQSDTFSAEMLSHASLSEDGHGHAFREQVHPRLEQPSHLCFHECKGDADYERFVNARAQLPERFCMFLSPLDRDEYVRGDLRLFLMEDSQAGYGLRGTELISVFSLPGAHRGALVAGDAIARGARRLDLLDANGKVERLYLSLGFQEVARYPWNESCAPSGWDYDLWGRPDFVVMELRDEERKNRDES